MKLKISTLFHWLYATLMFLPILMFIPSCLYYSFNEHATNTETTTINYKYQSNEVNTIDDLVEGNIYYLSSMQLYTTSGNLLILSVLKSSGIDNFPLNNIYDDLYQSENSNGILTFYWSNDDTLNIEFNSATLIYSFLDENYQYDLIVYDLDFIYTDDLYSYFVTNNYLPQYTDYNVIESVSVNTDDTITDKVNRAWSSIWDLPLFAWTHNSFVAAPFSYITGLFGLSSDNSINYVFTYFVSISICWLVFDLIMYVPNLAHRWLDRSAIE